MENKKMPLTKDGYRVAEGIIIGCGSLSAKSPLSSECSNNKRAAFCMLVTTNKLENYCDPLPYPFLCA